MFRPEELAFGLAIYTHVILTKIELYQLTLHAWSMCTILYIMCMYTVYFVYIFKIIDIVQITSWLIVTGVLFAVSHCYRLIGDCNHWVAIRITPNQTATLVVRLGARSMIKWLQTLKQSLEIFEWVGRFVQKTSEVCWGEGGGVK